MYGEITSKADVSGYTPSEEILNFTKEVRQDYERGLEILNRPWTELNDRSVIEDENRGQMMFNAFVDTTVEDPNEAWKYRGTRSYARNKGIALHANLTANFLLPLFTAQNENDEVDQDFSEVMRDIIEWMASPTNSNYQSSFLQVTLGALTNPVTYLGAEFCEIYQTIKERQEDGKYATKQVIDEVLSGFKAPVLSSSQVLITNAFERNIQKQRRIIKVRYAEKSELEAKYGHLENWAFIENGIRSIYSQEDGLFYDVKDPLHPNLCIEEIALSRRDDCEIPFVNGICMEEGGLDNNPIKHRDNRGAPKYNVVPFGYSRIGQHFFYYKSMMNALGWDNAYYDTMNEIVLNRAIIENEMPLAVSGSDKIDSEIIFPNSVITFEDPGTKVTPLLPNSNLNAGFNALREMEKSMDEGSVNETISGQLPDASQKAYSVAQAQASAKKLIGSVAKSIAESIIQYGDLMKDIAINHITAPQEVEELLGGSLKLKYKTFFLGSKTNGATTSLSTIKFDESLIGNEMNEEDKETQAVRLAEESGYPESKNSLRLINPDLFARFKYLSRVDIEEMFSKNQEYWQPVLLNLKTTLVNDPTIDQYALSRRLMQVYFQSDGDDFIKKATPVMSQPAQQISPDSNPLGSMVNKKLLSTVATGATG